MVFDQILYIVCFLEKIKNMENICSSVANSINNQFKSIITLAHCVSKICSNVVNITYKDNLVTTNK